MAEIEVENLNDNVTIRLRYPVAEAIKNRDALKPDYIKIPKLNKTTFESFAEWISDDLNDALVQILSDYYEYIVDEKKKSIKSGNNKDNDEPTVFEPW